LPAHPPAGRAQLRGVHDTGRPEHACCRKAVLRWAVASFQHPEAGAGLIALRITQGSITASNPADLALI